MEAGVQTKATARSKVGRAGSGRGLQKTKGLKARTRSRKAHRTTELCKLGAG